MKDDSRVSMHLHLKLKEMNLLEFSPFAITVLYRLLLYTLSSQALSIKMKLEFARVSLVVEKLPTGLPSRERPVG